MSDYRSLPARCRWDCSVSLLCADALQDKSDRKTLHLAPPEAALALQDRVMQVPVLEELLNGIEAAISQQVKQLSSSLICRSACQQHPAHCQDKGII